MIAATLVIWLLVVVLLAATAKLFGIRMLKWLSVLVFVPGAVLFPLQILGQLFKDLPLDELRVSRADFVHERLKTLGHSGKLNALGYSEASLEQGCQLRSGVELLSFPEVSLVERVGEARFCDEQITTNQRVLRRNQNKDCLNIRFGEPMPEECIVSAESAPNQAWSILFSCSRASREYYLSWYAPNLLTGGDQLESFAHIGFPSGQCLDREHREIITKLLDVLKVSQ